MTKLLIRFTKLAAIACVAWPAYQRSESILTNRFLYNPDKTAFIVLNMGVAISVSCVILLLNRRNVIQTAATLAIVSLSTTIACAIFSDMQTLPRSGESMFFFGAFGAIVGLILSMAFRLRLTLSSNEHSSKLAERNSFVLLLRPPPSSSSFHSIGKDDDEDEPRAEFFPCNPLHV